MRLILRGVVIRGRSVDVAVRNGLVDEVATSVKGRGEVIEGRGGALLPGLHDHHLHLLALAADRQSVDCSSGLQPLRHAPGGWVRGVRAAASVDRHALDRVVPDRPVRVQHRSGALWMLNTLALKAVSHVLDSSPDVERDERGEPTGRLWRYDNRLRAALRPQDGLDLSGLASELRSLGITSVTDATPDLDGSAKSLLETFDLTATLLGDPDGNAPQKIALRDHSLPSYDELHERISSAHTHGRPVAVHCVTRESLLLTLAVLDDVGRIPGDRIEHAAVVPEPAALTGLWVVTQPAFIAQRGDDYVSDVDPRDIPDLYRYRSLLRAGVRVTASSDAPYGPLDPWAVIRAAAARQTPSGRRLNPRERVSASTALRGYLTDANGDPRRIRLGAPADLVLFHAPPKEVLANPSADLVRGVVSQGRWLPGT